MQFTKALLVAALGSAMSLIADPISATAVRLRGSPNDYPRMTKHHGRRGTRYNGTPSYRPAIPYAKLAPIVDGVRMRWSKGVLVPRVQR